MNRHSILLWLLVVLMDCRLSSKAADTLQVITSPVSGPNASAAGHSMMPVITPDGRFVVFLSHANNLVTNDHLKPYLDIFIRDRELSTTTLLSVDRSGLGGGDGDSSDPAISSNGRFVLFASDANNLVSDDTNNASDIFLRDRNSGSTVLVSTTPTGTASSSGSINPAMTPDARWVVFESSASDLVMSDTNGGPDLFLRDMQSATTTLVTVGADSGRSHSAQITPDGRRIAFVSAAANLVADRTNRNGDVYVRDMVGNTTFWASSNLVAYFNNGPHGFRCFNPVISSDGRYVGFKAALSPSSAVHVFYHDLDAGTTEVIATNSHPNTTPPFSADGQWLAFEENDGIYLRHLPSGINLLVTMNAAGSGPANGNSLRPVITPNAGHVAFVSSATDLTTVPPPDGTNVFRIYLRDVIAGATYLVGSATNDLDSGSDMKDALPSISADGRFVGFDSDASDIVSDDSNSAYDVFVRDVNAVAAELVSVRDVSRAPRTGVQSAGLFRGSLSADGQRVLFSSYNDPRIAFDTNRHPDVFVRDLRGENLTSLSFDPAAPPATNGGIFEAVLSANGQAAIFWRQPRAHDYNSPYAGVQLFWRPTQGGAAQEIATDPDSSLTDTFQAALSPDGRIVVYPISNNYHLAWKDTITGSTGQVTQTWRNQAPAGPSHNPVFSHNGRFVAFASSAAYLAVSNFSGYFGRHMYVRDMQSNVTRILSVDTNGVGFPYARTTAGIFSLGDRYVAFWGTYESNNTVQVIFRHDLETGRNVLVASNAINPAISGNGNIIAYNEGNYYGSNIVVADVSSDQRRVITRNFSGNPTTAFREYSPPLLSPDGRFVVFATLADELASNDTNRFSDVFVHDRVQGTTMVISRSLFGPRAAAGISSKPVMSADGRTVVFQSFAGDLVEGDYNERRDIFVLRLGVGDSDNDGMDDDWEVAYFENLSRSGSGDFDSDGQSDLQEFLAGTDPTNDGSVLRVLTVTPMGGGSTTVVWSAVPNRNYIVQFKDSLDAAQWSNASGVIQADSTSESFAHASSSAQRFYRVTAVQ